MFLWFFGLPRLLASSLHCIGWGHLLLCIQLGRNNWVASFNIYPDWSWLGLSLQKGTFCMLAQGSKRAKRGKLPVLKVRPRTGIAVISTTFCWSEQVNKVSLDWGKERNVTSWQVNEWHTWTGWRELVEAIFGDSQPQFCSFVTSFLNQRVSPFKFNL